MPIPQSRVIDLLSAALDYKQAFEAQNHIIKTYAQEINDPRLTAIASYSVDQYLTDPIKTNITVTLEQKRISLTRRYNETRRAKAHLIKTEVPSLQTTEDEQQLLLEREFGHHSNPEDS
jgi:hypothetical protein